MQECSFAHACIAETIDGLRDGLTRFSGPSRTAVIYAIRPDDPMYVYDPQRLLTGHEPKFKELYIDSDEWKKRDPCPMIKKIQQPDPGKESGTGRADLIRRTVQFGYLPDVVYRTPSGYVLHRADGTVAGAGGLAVFS
jgi:hypothetical protein